MNRARGPAKHARPRNRWIVAVVSGGRAEFGLLRPILLALRSHPRLAGRLILTGNHAAALYGRTEREVRRDVPVHASVPWRYAEDRPVETLREMARALPRLGAVLRRLAPDLLLVLGDRSDVLPAVLSAGILGIPVAQLHGGDVSGAFLDNAFRASIAAFASLHLPATVAGARRLAARGAQRITVVGAPGIDAIRLAPRLGARRTRAALGLPPETRYVVLVQHPVLGEERHAARQIAETLAALRDVRTATVAVYPNADPGSGAVIRALRREAARAAREDHAPPFVLKRNLPHDLFVNVLRHAAALVGNSSCGVIETPFLKVPAVNVGLRQAGRERAANVLDAPHTRARIREALHTALYDLSFLRRVARCRNPYGDGRATRKTLLAIERFLRRAALAGRRAEGRRP